MTTFNPTQRFTILKRSPQPAAEKKKETVKATPSATEPDGDATPPKFRPTGMVRILQRRKSNTAQDAQTEKKDAVISSSTSAASSKSNTLVAPTPEPEQQQVQHHGLEALIQGHLPKVNPWGYSQFPVDVGEGHKIGVLARGETEAEVGKVIKDAYANREQHGGSVDIVYNLCTVHIDHKLPKRDHGHLIFQGEGESFQANITKVNGKWTDGYLDDDAAGDAILPGFLKEVRARMLRRQAHGGTKPKTVVKEEDETDDLDEKGGVELKDHERVPHR